MARFNELAYQAIFCFELHYVQCKQSNLQSMLQSKFFRVPHLDQQLPPEILNRFNTSLTLCMPQSKWIAWIKIWTVIIRSIPETCFSFKISKCGSNTILKISWKSWTCIKLKPYVYQAIWLFWVFKWVDLGLFRGLNSKTVLILIPETSTFSYFLR